MMKENVRRETMDLEQLKAKMDEARYVYDETMATVLEWR